MAMGPGVCLEYGGLRRYKPGSTVQVKQKVEDGSSYSSILLGIIGALLLFIVCGFTLGDLKSLL